MSSKREEVQKTIENWLTKRSDYFNAPYGILTGIEKLKSGGKVRTVTFGVSATLDATVTIWTPSRITIEAYGPLSSYITGQEVNSIKGLFLLLRSIPSCNVFCNDLDSN